MARTCNTICKICGKPFYSSPSRKANGGGRCCSRKCMSQDPEYLSNIRKAKLGQPRPDMQGERNPCYGKIGDQHPSFGHHHTQEAIDNIRKKNSGRKRSGSTLQKMSAATKKQFEDPEQRRKDSEAHKGLWTGNKNPKWKGGISPLVVLIRSCSNYKVWILSVFQRDKFTCQSCKKRGGDLEAHHIKPFAQILKENQVTTFDEALACAELWDVDNGITYCRKCHLEKHEKRRL